MDAHGRYVLALTVRGLMMTTAVFNGQGQLMANAAREIGESRDDPNSLDPDEVLTSAITLMEMVVRRAGISAYDIAALSISGPPHGCVLWDSVSGLPLSSFSMNVTTGSQTSESRRNDLCNDVQRVVSVRGEHGRLMLAGGMETWLIWNLAQGHSLVLDAGHDLAGLMDHADSYEGNWMRRMGLPVFQSPRVVPIVGPFARLSPVYLDGARVPITSLANHHAAALLGSGVPADVEAYVNFEVDGFVAIRTSGIGDRWKKIRTKRPNLMLSGQTFPAQLLDDVSHSLIGRFSIPQMTLSWIQATWNLFPLSAAETAAALEREGPIIAPYTSSMDGQAAIVGVNRGTTPVALYAAGLRSLAYTVADLLEEFPHLTGHRIQTLHVESIGYASPQLYSLQAGVSQVRVLLHPVDCASLGSALFAGLGAGLWTEQNVRNILAEQPDTITYDIPNWQEPRGAGRAVWRAITEQLHF